MVMNTTRLAKGGELTNLTSSTSSTTNDSKDDKKTDRMVITKHTKKVGKAKFLQLNPILQKNTILSEGLVWSSTITKENSNVVKISQKSLNIHNKLKNM